MSLLQPQINQVQPQVPPQPQTQPPPQTHMLSPIVQCPTAYVQSFLPQQRESGVNVSQRSATLAPQLEQLSPEMQAEADARQTQKDRSAQA